MGINMNQGFHLIRADHGLVGPVNTYTAGVAVLLNNGKITSVGRTNEIDFPDGATGEVHEFPFGTLLPGLIDGHTHTNMPGTGRRGEDVHREDTDDLRLMRAAQNVVTALRTGVTTVCDCGGWNQTTFSLKTAINQGLVDGPRLLTCGRPITTTGGHCWFMGSEADGTDGVRHAARQLIKEGADFLKVMGTGGSTLGTDPFRPAYSMEELRAIREEANRRDKRVVAHCRTNVAMRMVVDAGYDAIMHGWFTDDTGAKAYDEELAEHIAANQVFVNPTLHITKSRFQLFEGRHLAGDLSDEELAEYTRMQANHSETLSHCGRLFRSGVKLIAGSDCGWGLYPFGQFVLELQALVNAGLSPAEAIEAATITNAKFLGIGHEVGTVETGKTADLLVVDGNPTEDIMNIANVVAVFKDGRRVR